MSKKTAKAQLNDLFYLELLNSETAIDSHKLMRLLTKITETVTEINAVGEVGDSPDWSNLTEDQTKQAMLEVCTYQAEQALLKEDLIASARWFLALGVFMGDSIVQLKEASPESKMGLRDIQVLKSMARLSKLERHMAVTNANLIGNKKHPDSLKKKIVKAMICVAAKRKWDAEGEPVTTRLGDMADYSILEFISQLEQAGPEVENAFLEFKPKSSSVRSWFKAMDGYPISASIPGPAAKKPPIKK